MVLEYDLVSALCYLHQRRWQQAFDALERVITFPTRDNGCSKIMAEAFNKWVLTGLLLKGKTPVIPPTTGNGAQKAYNTLGKPYLAIAKAFEQTTAAQLRTELSNVNEQFFVEDGNLGLLNEVLRHYQKWQILSLRDVYAKIPLEKIRQTTQDGETAAHLETVGEVEKLLKSMIEDGMLRGVIEKPTDGKPAYLTFLSSTDTLSEEQFAVEIRASAQRIKNLEPVLKATNERLATSKDYIRHLIKEKSRAEKALASWECLTPRLRMRI